MNRQPYAIRLFGNCCGRYVRDAAEDGSSRRRREKLPTPSVPLAHVPFAQGKSNDPTSLAPDQSEHNRPQHPLDSTISPASHAQPVNPKVKREKEQDEISLDVGAAAEAPPAGEGRDVSGSGDGQTAPIDGGGTGFDGGHGGHAIDASASGSLGGHAGIGTHGGYSGSHGGFGGGHSGFSGHSTFSGFGGHSGFSGFGGHGGSGGHGGGFSTF